MSSIARSYAGAARNWLRGGMLSNPRVTYGRQFELDSDDDVLVSVPSTDLFIDENKKLLAELSRHHYIKAGMICRDKFQVEEDMEILDKPEKPEKYPEISYRNDVPEDINEAEKMNTSAVKHMMYDTDLFIDDNKMLLAELSMHHYKSGMICREQFQEEYTKSHDNKVDEHNNYKPETGSKYLEEPKKKNHERDDRE